MGIQYFDRGGCRLRRHPPLKILDAHPLWHHRRWAKQKTHLLFSNSSPAPLQCWGLIGESRAAQFHVSTLSPGVGGGGNFTIRSSFSFATILYKIVSQPRKRQIFQWFLVCYFLMCRSIFSKFSEIVEISAFYLLISSFWITIFFFWKI